MKEIAAALLRCADLVAGAAPGGGFQRTLISWEVQRVVTAWIAWQPQQLETPGCISRRHLKLLG